MANGVKAVCHDYAVFFVPRVQIRVQLLWVAVLWLSDLRDTRVGPRLKHGRVLRRLISLKARARGQLYVSVPTVDRNVGPVPVQGHDAAIDHLVLGTGRQNRVLSGPPGRRCTKSANVLVDWVPEA